MLIVDKEPNSIVSEAYRTLRTNIQYSSFDKKIQCIVITSAEPREGKSTTATNLALSLASDGKKTLLVDCDLRKPSINKYFNLSKLSGVTEIILGKESLAKAIKKHNNLDILTSGKVPPNPSEMLGSNLMEKLLDELKSIYDYIIIDAPPTLAVTDAQILSTKADGTILVVKSLVTKKESVLNAQKSLQKVKANIIGTVLNDLPSSSSKYYYYYGENNSK